MEKISEILQRPWSWPMCSRGGPAIQGLCQLRKCILSLQQSFSFCKLKAVGRISQGSSSWQKPVSLCGTDEDEFHLIRKYRIQLAGPFHKLYHLHSVPSTSSIRGMVPLGLGKANLWTILASEIKLHVMQSANSLRISDRQTDGAWAVRYVHETGKWAVAAATEQSRSWAQNTADSRRWEGRSDYSLAVWLLSLQAILLREK